MDASQAKEFRQKLVTISDIILNNASSHGELLHHTHNLFKELETISSVEAFRHLPVAPVILSSGKAIDPFSAAHCLVER